MARRFHLAALGPRVKRHRPVRPMLAKLVDEPFDREGWLFEVKWDGYRAIAEIEGKTVALYSRNGLSFEAAFAPIVKSLAKINRRAILDGEVVVLDEQGRSNFQALQNFIRFQSGTLVYYVFDLLALDGKDLRSEPLRVRKASLEKIVRKLPNVHVSEHIERHGEAMFQEAMKWGLEGIIAKKADSQYREGERNGSWLKIKVRQRQEAVICGYTPPKGSRVGLGSLVLGVRKKGQFDYVGNVGTGFSDKTLRDLTARLSSLINERCPFDTRPKLPAPVH